MRSFLHMPCYISIARSVGVLVACLLVGSCLSKGSPGIGDEAHTVTLKALGGEASTLNPSSGVINILYFWADWCVRCEDDFRMLDSFQAKMQKERADVHLVAINVGQTEDHVRNFSNRMKTSFPLYMDKDGKIARSFGVNGLPTYFVIDGYGKVRHIVLGWADDKGLVEEIRKIDNRRRP